MWPATRAVTRCLEEFTLYEDMFTRTFQTRLLLPNKERREKVTQWPTNRSFCLGNRITQLWIHSVWNHHLSWGMTTTTLGPHISMIIFNHYAFFLPKLIYLCVICRVCRLICWCFCCRRCFCHRSEAEVFPRHRPSAEPLGCVCLCVFVCPQTELLPCRLVK